MSAKARLKAVVPRRQQRALLDRRVQLRRRTDARRPLPDFLVIGAQRGGTSSLYKWLESHPDVAASLRKETEYLSMRHGRGEDWYRAHFPSRLRHRAHALRGRRLQTFEASPYYLLHPLAPERAAALVPDARLVVLLRHPVDRAWSHHQHMVALGRETLGFADAIAAEGSRLSGIEERLRTEPDLVSRVHQRHSYLARGEYAPQLERWLAVFPREHLLALRSDDLYADPASAFAAVCDHVGLSPHQPATFANHSRQWSTTTGSTTIDPALRSQLDERVAPWIAATEGVLGIDLGWRR